MVHIPFLTSAWSPEGKHCFITGGSQGLGMSLGVALASQGAHVTLVARSETKLEKAAEAAFSARKSEAQKISFFPADVSSFAGAKEAIEWSASKSEKRTIHSCSASVGEIPDAVFACAGGASPGFFLHQKEEDFQAGIKTNLQTALATSHAAASIMVKGGVKGKIVLISSTAGLMALPGYQQYSPMKHAIRGLAEGLRTEMLLYDISVHCYFPGTIFTPGYELENRTKPALTRAIEGTDGLTPEQCAAAMIKGIQRDHFFITSDFQTELFRVAATGITVPSNNWLWDKLVLGIAQIALPIWRHFDADRTIRKYAKDHPEEVRTTSRDRDANSNYRTIFLLSLTHRLLVLIALLILPNLITPFDASPHLQMMLDAGHGQSTATQFASHLIRWDSLHFLGLANPAAMPRPTSTPGGEGLGGYAYEHSLAFQPGIIWLLRLAGYLKLGSTWSLTGAIFLTSAAAVLTSSLCCVLLYHLLLSLRIGRRFAFLASTLSILSPSPSTLVTPTPEPFFGLFTLLALCFLSAPVDVSVKNSPISWSGPTVLQIILSSCLIALSSAFRANGVLLVGHIWYNLLWQRSSKRSISSFVIRLVCLPLTTAIAVAPLVLNQIWAYKRFCLDSQIQRPWCGQTFVYNFVQSEYWNVGLFKYWELAQMPNFALAAPVLFAASWVSYQYYSSAPHEIIQNTCLGWLFGRHRRRGVTAKVETSSLSHKSSPRLLPHIHLSTITVLLLFFASHVQIALRFASPAWVGVWLGIAHLVVDHKSGKVTSSGRTWLTWLILWNIASVVLFAAFLPPA
ncbi:unnamed protein product [Sympodiomycopsis kandeliae]